MAGRRIVIPNLMPALDSNGDPVPGAKLYFYQNKTTTLASIYADEGLATPLANPVVADASGVFPSIFADEALAFTVAATDASAAAVSNLRNQDDVRPSLSIVALEEAPSADTLTAAQAVPADGLPYLVVESRSAAADGYFGSFEWVPGDQSANVTADTQKARFIAPSSDTTGASGAWRRQNSSFRLNTDWFGVTPNTATSQATAFNAAVALSKGFHLDIPKGDIRLNTAISVTNGSATSVRNIFWHGAGGVNDSTNATATRLSPRNSSGACFTFTSVFGMEMSNLFFSGRVAGAATVVRQNAAADPGMSGTNSYFHRCQIAGPESGGTSGPMWEVINQKFVRAFQCFLQENPSGQPLVRIGANAADSSGTLQGGDSGYASFDQITFEGSMDVRRGGQFTVQESTFSNGGGITSSGDRYGLNVRVINCGFISAASIAAITTANSTPPGATSPGSSGWVIEGAFVRDYVLGVQINCPTVVRSSYFACRRSGDRGIDIASGVDQVFIENSNDFRNCFLNGSVAVTDNRTGALTDQFILDYDLAADTTLSAVGSFADVISQSTHRPYRGGKIRASAEVGILNNDGSARNFTAQVLFNGAVIDLQTITIPAGGYGTISLRRAARAAALAATFGTPTLNSTVKVQVKQSAGTAATISGLSGTVGRTFCQVEELP